MTRVYDLEIGDKIKFNQTEVFVRGIEKNRVIVSKQRTGNYVFSVPMTSHKHEDLHNRVEVA